MNGANCNNFTDLRASTSTEAFCTFFCRVNDRTSHESVYHDCELHISAIPYHRQRKEMERHGATVKPTPPIACGQLSVKPRQSPPSRSASDFFDLARFNFSSQHLTSPTSNHIYPQQHTFTMGFTDFVSETGLHVLNSWVSTRSYIIGYVCSTTPSSLPSRDSLLVSYIKGAQCTLHDE
jgi:hypothetical protein